MIKNMLDKPLWYKLWVISVGVGAIYFVIVIFLKEPTAWDWLIEVYVFISILVNRFLVLPKLKPNESK